MKDVWLWFFENRFDGEPRKKVFAESDDRLKMASIRTKCHLEVHDLLVRIDAGP